MEPSLYTGRKVQKHILTTFLTGALGKPGSSSGNDDVTPRIIVLYGDPGLGKTSIIDLCLESLNELPMERGKTPVSVVLDLELLRFKNGTVPKTPRLLLDSIYTAALGTNQKVADALEPYGALNQKINNIERTRTQLIREEWPHEVFLSGGDGASESAFRAWLEKKIPTADLLVADNPVEQLSSTLADCFGKLSKKSPLVFCIDGFERAATPELEQWLTDQFLPLLTKEKQSIAVIMSTARAANVRTLRNKIREELLYTVPLAEMPLTERDIAAIAKKRSIPLDDVTLEEISLATAGVPLIVQSALDNVHINAPLGNVLPGSLPSPSNAVTLLQQIVSSFIKSSESETVKQRVFSLSMLSHYNENVIRELWGPSGNKIDTAFSELAARYSFIKGNRLHDGVRDNLRSLLVAEAARPGTPLAGFFLNFSKVNSAYYTGCYSKMHSEISDPATRFADTVFQASVLGIISSVIWSNPAEAMKLLPGYFTEAIHYNPDFAGVLLGITDDFLPLLSPEFLTMIDSLRAILPHAEKIVKAPLIPGDQANANALDFLTKFHAGMTDTQKGLLQRMKGVLACSVGDFDQALDAFNKSGKLFGGAKAAEQALLFEDYLCVGYAFAAKTGDHKKAIEALSKALTIKSSNFHAWNELAKAHQAIGDHTAAIESYCEAVKIDSNAADSWIELGNEYALLGEHAHAVDSFTHLTQLDPERAAAWLKLGKSQEALGNFSEALAALGKAVTIAPDNWEALFALGKTQTGQGMRQDAIASFKKVVELKPDHVEAWKSLGTEQYSAEFFEEAAQSLEKAAAIEAGDYGLWSAIGKAWQGACKYESAVIACVKAVGLNPSWIEAWITLGQCQTELSNFNEAYASFAKAAELSPNDHEIWVSMGNSLYAQGKYNEAIEAFVKATQLKPDAENIWHNIGLAYQVQKKFIEAIESYHNEVAINPNVYETWYQQGRAYAELNQYTESAQCFTKAVELSPESHDAWYRMGLALAKSGDHTKAIEAFIKSVELYQGDADIWFQLGLSYAANGNHAEAVESLEQSLAIADNRPEVHYQLGLAREALGQYDEAIAVFQKVIDLSPEKAEAWLHLGLCFNFQNKYEESLPAFHKAIEIAPDNAEVLLPMALAAHAVGQNTEAISLYRQVIALNGESEEAWYNLALALHAENDIEEALKTYHIVLQKWPQKDQAWHNMGLIYHTIGDLPHARDSYREAARLNPELTDSWYQLGMVYYSTGQYGDAIQSFRKVTIRKPEMYEAWFNLGNAYLIWNENQDAIEAYKKAIDVKPDDFSSWGYLGSAYYAIKAYDKAAEASSKAFDLKSDEPWIMSTLALSRLMTKDTASAETMIDTLRATDTTGQEVAKTINELQKLIALNPDLSGAQELLQKIS